MAYALIAQTSAASADGLSVTTASIDTTGADLILLFVSDRDDGDAENTPTDNKSNTWSPLTSSFDPGSGWGKWYYAKNAVVGSGHTFTVTVPGTSAGGVNPSVAALAFSGSHLTAPFDKETGTTGFPPPIQPGSQTPTNDNELVVQGLSFNVAQTAAPGINESYNFAGTTADYRNFTATSRGIAVAYKIQTTATATNPTWTLDTSAAMVARSASFIVAGAAGGGVGSFVLVRSRTGFILAGKG